MAGPLWNGFDAAASSASSLYVVAAGDTLSEIAERHGVSLSRIRALNHLRSDLILPGQRLRLRGGVEYPLLRPVRTRITVANLNRPRWHHIILHHSATANGNAAIFDRYHRQRGMENGLAYHFLIGNGTDSGDGEIEIGNRWTRQLQGGHVRSLAYNENSIGICLVGDFERTHPTQKQLAAELELVEFLKRALLGGRPTILVHREVPGEHTLCPGRHFPVDEFKEFRA